MASDNQTIEYYQINSKKVACPHCLWVNEFPWRGNVYKSFQTIRPTSQRGSKDFFGITVFDSRGRFIDTFNCVNGVKYGDSRLFHDYRELGNLLEGVTYFIEDLHVNYGINHVKVLINSNVNKYYKVKEHLHALVTLDKKEADALYAKIDKDKIDRKDEQLVASEPWKTDSIIELSPNDGSELIRSGRYAISNVAKLLETRLKTRKRFDYKWDNFYIFLDFECTKRCGIVKGAISTDARL